MSLFLKSLKELPPFGQALGMVLDEADTGPGVAVLLPGAERLSGDAEDEVFHTGVILATIDNTAGWCIRDHPGYAEGTSMAHLWGRARRSSAVEGLWGRAVEGLWKGAVEAYAGP